MLIDTHAHLSKKDDLEKILQEAKENGVEKIILAGTTLKDSESNLLLSKRYPEIYASIGVYPHEETDKSIKEIFQTLENFAQKNSVIAIGECGLDYKETKRSAEGQKELFRMQIGLAIEQKLPLIIHSRNSYGDVLTELKKYEKAGKLKGGFHCFSGNLETAVKIIELGFYISFTGIITYSSGKYLLDIIKKVPLDKILVETDSPFLVPEPLRSAGIKKNSPKNVKIVAGKIAEIKGVLLEEVAKVTTENAGELFGV